MSNVARSAADSSLFVRAAVLYMPVALVIVCAPRTRGTSRLAAAVVAGTSWNLAALSVLNACARTLGWWTFTASEPTVGGVPPDVMLGWSLLWGAVPVVASAAARVNGTGNVRVRCGWWVTGWAAILAIFDVAVMPQCDAVVSLHARWLVGESVAVVAVLVPGLLISRWTLINQRVWLRSQLLALAFGVLLLVVLPVTIFRVTGEDWREYSHRSSIEIGALLIAALGCCWLGLSAVAAFARAQGTAVPLDPPNRLVTAGPYAYIRNPMQVSGAALLVLIGAATRSWPVLCAAGSAVLFANGWAARVESEHLLSRFGSDWLAYKRNVGAWIPRWQVVRLIALGAMKRTK